MPTCANNSHPSPIAHVPLIAPILLITFCVLSHRLRPTPPFAPHRALFAHHGAVSPPAALRAPSRRLAPCPYAVCAARRALSTPRHALSRHLGPSPAPSQRREYAWRRRPPPPEAVTPP
ncbi:hypothetical protein DENSPDRAFT_887057 [Dentipellis sp. KUC8613]|nr:hypothetical protein DENSPDRAFT_887057 [Dentipellis sp. KUC8613]